MDEFTYDQAMRGQDERFKATSKRFMREYSDVNNSSYAGSQILFNLPSISTEDGFLALRESSVGFAYTVAVVSDTNLAAMKDRMLALKCGVQNLISGVSIKIDNQEVKNLSCDMENIPLTYKILSQSSPMDEANLHDSLIFAKDNADSIAYRAGAGECSGILLKPVPAIGDTTEGDSVIQNDGMVKRLQKTSFDPTNPESAKFTNLAKTIARRKSHIVNVDATTIVYHLWVTIPLTFLTYDLFDAMPALCKGVFLQMNINIHSGSSTFDITHATKAISAQVPVTRFGVCPVMLALPEESWDSTADSTLTVSYGINRANSVYTNDFGATSAVFNACFYKLRPEYEQQLLAAAPSAKVRYTQLYNHVQPSVGAGANFSVKVSNSSAKMRWLLIHTSLAEAANGATLATATTGGTASPMNSLFSSSPVTTMKHASITNLQVLIGGQPLYETPLSYGYDQFLHNMRGINSINGGQVLGLSSGLISERDWEGCYAYILIDLSRYENDSADAVSKPLEVRGINNTMNLVDYRFYLATEAEFSISTTTGKVTM